jgi:hypothetical protein
MLKMSILDRILLLVTVLLAGYQIAVGIEGLSSTVISFYTIGFGVLLIACILLIILGFEILDSSLAIVIAAFIPLSISLGLVWQFLPEYKIGYLVFAVGGIFTILITRYVTPGRPATIVLTLVHGVAGLLIFALPFMLSIQGKTDYGFMLVGLGGALFGIAGLSFAFLRAGKPLLSTTTVFKLLPALLMLITLSFVIGMELG